MVNSGKRTVTLGGKNYLLLRRVTSDSFDVFCVDDDRHVGSFSVGRAPDGHYPRHESARGGSTSEEIRAIAIVGIHAGLTLATLWN